MALCTHSIAAGWKGLYYPAKTWNNVFFYCQDMRDSRYDRSLFESCLSKILQDRNGEIFRTSVLPSRHLVCSSDRFCSSADKNYLIFT